MNPAYLIDAYKIDHRRMYPKGTTKIYSNMTARSSMIKGVDDVVFFGLQAFLQKHLIEEWGAWFSSPEDDVCSAYERRTTGVLGLNDVGTDHIRALHRLGYLPLEFRALPEGTSVPLRVPMFTIENTNSEFFWLTNYIESVLSSAIWLPCTSATIALRMRKLCDKWAKKTADDELYPFVDWQGHDFSFRGMSSPESASLSGAGHLLSFSGTDTMCALDVIEKYYDSGESFLGGSVPATEHSVMSAGGKGSELETFDRLLALYPSGVVSVVSDTWDLWEVLTETLPKLKDQILARDGKLVIRPDSGDPANILCGDKSAETGSPANLGVIRILWQVFGGKMNAKGFRQLDSHIGAIYGDSINYERADDIFKRLAELGFASTNVVFGVGSFTYQLQTRDVFGMAMKATWAEINGEGVDLFKDPVTDSGLKRSAKGRLSVRRKRDGGPLYLIEQASEREQERSLLQPVWRNGEFINRQKWGQIVSEVGVRALR